MPTVEISFNSKRDLNNQIERIGEARLDAVQVGQARRRAVELDNDGKNNAGERVTLKINCVDPSA